MVIHKSFDQASHESIASLHLANSPVLFCWNHFILNAMALMPFFAFSKIGCVRVDSDMVWKPKRVVPKLLHHLQNSGWASVFQGVCHCIVCELVHHANHYVVVIESANVDNVRLNAISKLTCCYGCC